MKKHLDRFLYYWIIGIVSLIAVMFLPMVGTEIGLKWNLPNTVTGWIVWGVCRLIICGLNILIFHSFMQQAKLNVAEDPHYQEAQSILFTAKNKEEAPPRSPTRFNREQYGRKGATIFLGSAASTVALTQALLSYDYMSALTYLFTIVMGVILGVMQMKNAENYWTIEYLQYAKLIQKGEQNDNLQ